MSKTNYEMVKAWRAKNPDKVAEQARRRRAKKPEHIRAQQDAWRAVNKEHVREYQKILARKIRARDPEGERRRKRAQADKRIMNQDIEAGRPRPLTCEVCGGNGAGCHPHHRIVFDHCHESGFFRGWLCDRCNKVLGLVKDDPSLLYKLATYLEETNVEIDNKRKKQVTG